jgi:glycosyltransferase involved in cell wall biosynthesis
MRRLTDALVVYTETEARELRARMPGAEITATPNALYSVNEIGPAPGASPCTFVYVGRLVESKKPGLALDAFLRVRRDLPLDCTLVFIGDGPLRLQLQSTARVARAQDRVRFLGPCDATDTALLRSIYGESIASLSPGYVGLSIIQSLSFGIPMILARDEPHAPEIEAAVEGENAVIVESDSPDAFGRALVTVARERDSWLARRPAIARRCAERYAVELMAERLLASVRGRPASR